MGFETTSGWAVKSASAFTGVASTTTRTQGSFAFALLNPPARATLTSLPVVSTAGALTGVGDTGALFEVDVMLPAEGNKGTLKLSVTSRTRGLSSRLIGQVDLTGFRTGIYNTMNFPIPDDVRSALGGAAFNDLSFQFELSGLEASVPVSLPGATAAQRAYLFDNLRVHSVPLPSSTGSALPVVPLHPPASFGGSVDLAARGDTPAAQSFGIGAVQVPDSLHLKQGSAGTTTVKLALGHDGAPAFTCTYGADSSDATGQSYNIGSCTGGVQAGDVVGANWAQLTIVGGSSQMQIQAQLARNPLGDLVGANPLPPMPTFWGDFDACTPTAPVAGKVVPAVSTSCANQAALTNRIVTDYFKKVAATQPDIGWVVTPAPDFARRHSDGSPQSNRVKRLDPTQNDAPFDQEGHLNPGGTFDAFWRLNGDFNTTGDTSKGNTTAHLDATFSANAVLFGQSVSVASLTATVDTASGSAPSATGSLQAFLFGQQVPGGESGDATTGFNFGISQSQDFDLPPIQIWIFQITFGVTGSVGVNAAGRLAPTGFNVSVTPQASIGAHLEGGISLGLASGLDARIDLIEASTPVTAQVSLFIDSSPQQCAITVNSSLNAQATVSSGGGEVDLVATFGICPFCDSDSWTLFSWGPLASFTTTLIDLPLTSGVAVPLPVAACTQPLNVTIQAPTGSVASGTNVNLVASVDGPAGSVTTTWTGFVPGDSPATPNTTGQETFGPAGTRTLTAAVVDNITDRFGRTIVDTGSATETIQVKQLQAGSYIIATTPAPIDNVCAPSFGCTELQPPFNGQSLTFQEFSFPASITLIGEVLPSIGTTTTTWTATDSSGTTTVIPPPKCINPLICAEGGLINSNPNQVSVNWSVARPDVYTITMTTKDSSGHVVGTATMTASVPKQP